MTLLYCVPYDGEIFKRSELLLVIAERKMGHRHDYTSTREVEARLCAHNTFEGR